MTSGVESMGSSGWRYFVPYQPDMGRVLEDLKHDVLARCDYTEPLIDLSFLDEMEFFEAEDSERERMFAEYDLGPLRWAIDRSGLDGLRDWLESCSRDQEGSLEDRRDSWKGRPRSREELQALQCLSWEGTHSILDIGGVSPDRADRTIYPLPQELLLSLFGTDRPGRGDVEAWLQRYDPSGEAFYDRGQGFYLTVYKAGRPDEIYIEGASGD